jgi:hypothetical protein
MNPRKKSQSELNAVLARGYWRAKEAERVLEAWRQSGLALSVFARRHGLNRSRLMRWKGVLEGQEPQAALVFHPIRVMGGKNEEVARGESLELILRGGRRVSVRRGFDAEVLEELVRVLESFPC